MTDKDIFDHHSDEINGIIQEDIVERAVLLLGVINGEGRSLIVGEESKIVAMIIAEMRKDDSPMLDIMIGATLGYVVLDNKENELLNKFKDLFDEDKT